MGSSPKKQSRPESVGQGKLIRRLTLEGWHVTKIIATSRRGFPDLLCFRSGDLPMLIECKTSGKQATVQQQAMLNQFREFGCVAVAWDVDSDTILSDRQIPKTDTQNLF